MRLIKNIAWFVLFLPLTLSFMFLGIIYLIAEFVISIWGYFKDEK